jgi:hypothetical protein
VIAAAIAIVALAALLAYREWTRARELQAAAEERKELYQRIQAPDIAVADATEQPFDGLPYVGIEDDKGFQAELERIEDG